MDVSNHKVELQQELDNYALEKEHFDVYIEKQNIEAI